MVALLMMMMMMMMMMMIIIVIILFIILCCVQACRIGVHVNAVLRRRCAQCVGIGQRSVLCGTRAWMRCVCCIALNVVECSVVQIVSALFVSSGARL